MKKNAASAEEDKKTPEQIKEFLKERFASLSEDEIQTMKKIQSIVRKVIPEDVSLSDELILERKKEAK